MFSESLRILDSNTIDFMIDNLKQTIAEQASEISENENTIAEQASEIAQLRAQLAKEQDQENDEDKNSLT